MKEKLGKFDYIVILILVFGIVFLVQQWIFAQNVPAGNQKLFVKVKAPVEAGTNLSNIKELYFSNSREVASVSEIKLESPTEAIITLEGTGESDSTKFIFDGEHVSLNQRIKLHGILEVEGTVTDLGSR